MITTRPLNNIIDKYNLKLALYFTGVVLALVAVAGLIFNLPKPLLVTLGSVFLACSAFFWGLRPPLKRPAKARILQLAGRLLFLWLLMTTLLLSSVYSIDRAGWLWFRLTGYDVVLAEDLTDQVNQPLEAFIRRHPLFAIDPQDPTGLVLPQGDYQISETILVPAGSKLTIEPGTVLRFAAGRSLISYSPIIARGTEQAPIRFIAQRKWLKWGAVGLVRTGASVFEYVEFEHGRRAQVNGIDFFGSLSVIETDVKVLHSRFSNAFGKDSLNIRFADFLVQHNTFQNAYKDGLDIDGGSGLISHNRFIDCDDEGIDLSENEAVQVFDNTVLDRRGGRIAAEQNLDEILALNTLGYSR